MLCTSETLHTPLIYNYCETLATWYPRLAETAVQEAGPSLRGMGRLWSIHGLPSTMPHSMVEMPHSMVETPHSIDLNVLSFRRKQVALGFHLQRLLRRHIQQWQLSSKWSRDVGWKEDLAFDHHCGTLLLKCMAGWNLVRCDADPSDQSSHTEPLRLVSALFNRFWGRHGLFTMFC